MLKKVNLLKLGRCIVCGTLIEDIALLMGSVTCSELCTRAKACNRTRDEQLRWEYNDRKVSEMGRRNKGKKLKQQ
jgi:predicted nucleic acid-binding Zn ribbon protein